MRRGEFVSSNEGDQQDVPLMQNKCTQWSWAWRCHCEELCVGGYCAGGGLSLSDPTISSRWCKTVKQEFPLLFESCQNVCVYRGEIVISRPPSGQDHSAAILLWDKSAAGNYEDDFLIMGQDVRWRLWGAGVIRILHSSIRLLHLI